MHTRRRCVPYMFNFASVRLYASVPLRSIMHATSSMHFEETLPLECMIKCIMQTDHEKYIWSKSIDLFLRRVLPRVSLPNKFVQSDMSLYLRHVLITSVRRYSLGTLRICQDNVSVGFAYDILRFIWNSDDITEGWKRSRRKRRMKAKKRKRMKVVIIKHQL